MTREKEGKEHVNVCLTDKAGSYSLAVRFVSFKYYPSLSQR